MIDFSVMQDGSIVLIRPMTSRADDWVKQYIQLEPWQWLGMSFGIDARFSADILRGILDSGLTFVVGYGEDGEE